LGGLHQNFERNVFLWQSSDVGTTRVLLDDPVSLSFMSAIGVAKVPTSSKQHLLDAAFVAFTATALFLLIRRYFWVPFLKSKEDCSNSKSSTDTESTILGYLNRFLDESYIASHTKRFFKQKSSNLDDTVQESFDMDSIGLAPTTAQITFLPRWKSMFGAQKENHIKQKEIASAPTLVALDDALFGDNLMEDLMLLEDRIEGDLRTTHQKRRWTPPKRRKKAA
jgi:hypothetical protein